MAINTTLYQTSPYYDDYVSSGNEAKGHLKILFKPGVSVQVRELNQLQTLLQTQIDRFGSHIFENGSRVLDGEVVFDPSLYFIDITFTDPALVVNGSSPSASAVSTRISTYLKQIESVLNPNDLNPTVGLSADVVSVEALVANDTETKYRLFLRYTKKTDAETFFSRLQTIRSKNTIKDADGLTELVSIDDVIGTVQKVGYASKLHVNKGVFFIGGYFVNVEATDVFIERPNENTRLTGKLAFKVTEAITNSVGDTTLLDNSTGTPNAAAPGADRYTITLSLVLLTDQSTILNVDYNENKVYNLTTSAASTDFISLVTIESNRVIRPLSAQYADGAERLGGVIARRTYEESGNYTLNPFIIDVREAYNDGGNRGRFSATETSDINTLKSKYAMGIEPSIAYVEGYRVELKNRIELLADKARDQVFNETVSINSGLGTYIEGKFTAATLPDIENNNSPVSSYIVQGTSPESTITPTGLEKVRGTGLDTVYRLYFTLGSASYADLNSATNIIDATVSPQVQFNPIEATFKVKGNKQSSKLIPLSRKVVSAVNTDNTMFVVRKEFNSASTSTFDITYGDIGSGKIVLTGLSAGQTFFRKDVNDYIVSNGSTFCNVTDVTFNDSFTEVTLTLDGITDGSSFQAIASVRTTLTLATKTVTTTSVTSTGVSSPEALQTGDVINLGVTDIIEIDSITVPDSPTQEISLSDFVLDNGQRDDSYQNGTLTYVGDTEITGIVTVNFKHFTHSGSGTYFSRESYPSTFDYAKIPVYRGNRLSDVLDFRGTNGSELDPNTQIRLTIDYYLPRYDQLILTRRGEFLINKGVSSLDPSLPETPKGSIVLYNLYLPAYTFDAKAIDTEYFDHRRYTMRDIGNLEKRIKNIEYYTSLSLLEQEAKDKKIFDGSGERFKNGIFVDSFTGHNRGAVTDPGYKCSIDYLNGHLRPSFDINNVEVRVDGDSDDNYIRLPSVATETVINQKYASVHESVIPFGTSNYRGTLQISPCGDSWYEVQRRPDLTNNPDGNYDNIEQGSDNTRTSGTVWNIAQVNWMGRFPGETLLRRIRGNMNLRGLLTTSADYLTQSETPRVREIRIGDVNDSSVRVSPSAIRENTSGNIISENGDGRVVETTMIPFIRSRRVYFKAMGMKPNTRLYAYFDETNITGYATKLASGNFEQYLNRNVVNRVDFYNKNAAESFALLGDVRSDLTTDLNGTIEGYFIIPNNAESRFGTGQRIFTLSDTNNGVNDPLVTTRARARYTVTPDFDLSDCNLDETRIPEPSEPDNTVYPVPYTPNTPDPVAQYALSVDKYNVEEGESFTVTLNTQNIVNGTNVPYTITGVTTDDLSGATGSSLTGNFTIQNNTASITFNARIDSITDESDSFLLELTNNPEHYVSVAIDDALFESVDGEIRALDGNPRFLGYDYYTSTQQFWNNYTFCREDPLAQSFKLSDVGIPQGALIKSIDLYFQSKNDNVPVTVQIVEVENGYPTQRLVKHGVKTLPSDLVYPSTDASTATNFAFHSPVYLEANREYAFIVRSSSADYRIWLSEIDGTDVLTGERISRDPYLGVAFRSANASTWTAVQTRDIKFKLNAHTFMTSTETTRTRAVGPGTVTEIGTGYFQSIINNAPFNVTSVQFSPGQLILPRTSIEYKLVIGGTRYDLKSDGTHLHLPSTVSVSSASNIKLEANLKTDDKYLSPLIDFDRIMLICNGNIINDDVTNETNAAHGNATARYITKKVSLNNPADKLNIYIGAYRPDVSNIRVYARFDDEISSPQVLDLNDATWTLVPSVPISETADADTLQEIEYEIDPTNDFTQFQLKIVMTSTNAAKTPIINDLRAIASI